MPIVVENSGAVNEDQNKNLENIESANFDIEVAANGEPPDEGKKARYSIINCTLSSNLLIWDPC